VLTGTIGGLLLGVTITHLRCPSTFRFQGLDVLDICRSAGAIGGVSAGGLIVSSPKRRGTPS
jgi:hypothetical protein